jgi:hypothetical protein
VVRMRINIRNGLLLGFDAIARRVGQSRVGLIHVAMDLFIREQQRSQSLVDCWGSDDVQEFSDWPRRVQRCSDSSFAAS